jgi:type IV secretory pathway TraG/TraD family ATPase VirD4
LPAPEDPLADWQARVGAAGSPIYLGAGTAGPVLAPPQQAVLVLGPPRSGKTSSLVVPNIVGAAGAVVATSTKPDVLEATWRARSTVGRCWLFDPAGVVKAPPGVTPVRWSPVQGSRDWESALLTARAIAGAARPGGRFGESAHWTERAEAMIAPLLHAAAVSDADMGQVMRWVNRHDLDSGLAALSLAGARVAVDVLSGLAATDSRELSGIWSTTAGILSAYRSETALDRAGDSNFDPGRLPLSGDTVYICSPARHQDLAAPIVVALLEQIRGSAYNAPPGRPPVLLALDEAANIAPLPNLPAIVSEGGSQGLVTLACFQDLSQARVRWGAAADGFLSLFGVKVVLPGIGDLRTLELVSRLAGDHDVAVRSVSRRPWWSGRQGGPTVSWTTRRQPRLPVDAVAHLSPGTAVLINGALPPAWLRLTPWYLTAPFAAAVLRRPLPELPAHRPPARGMER